MILGTWVFWLRTYNTFKHQCQRWIKNWTPINLFGISCAIALWFALVLLRSSDFLGKYSLAIQHNCYFIVFLHHTQYYLTYTTTASNVVGWRGGKPRPYSRLLTNLTTSSGSWVQHEFNSQRHPWWGTTWLLRWGGAFTDWATWVPARIFSVIIAVSSAHHSVTFCQALHDLPITCGWSWVTHPPWH